VEPFAVPGFEVVELLGFGATGEVWLAREQASGEEVALKRLRRGAPAGARDRIRHEAGLLASLRHPHLVRLRAVVELADDLVLVLDHAGGGNLERLLAERGFLAPGEVVTLLTPLAQALEDLHRQGVVHGDVAPANVVLDLAGRPLLADLGIARVLGTPVTAVQGREAFLDPAVLDGAAPAPSADVYALAAVGALALGDERADQSSQAVALRQVLSQALVREAFLRPTAGQFASRVYAACAPVPLVLSQAAAGARGSGEVTHRVRPAVSAPAVVAQTATEGAFWRHGWTRRAASDPPEAHRHRTLLLMGLAAGLGLVLAASVGVAWAGLERPGGGAVLAGPAPAAAPRPSGPPAAAPVSSGPATAATPAIPPTPEWRAVLADLDAIRARAYQGGDAALLHSAYIPGAPAGDRDARSLAALVGDGRSIEGLSLTPTTIAPLEVNADRAVLRVVDTMAPHVVTQRGSGATETRPGRGERAWTVILARSKGQWLVWDVLEGGGWPPAAP
jgi:hypothetical protein